MAEEDNGKKPADEKKADPDRVVYEFKVTERQDGALELRPSGQYVPEVNRCVEMMKRLVGYLEMQQQSAMTVKMLMDVQTKIAMDRERQPKIFRPN